LISDEVPSDDEITKLLTFKSMSQDIMFF